MIHEFKYDPVSLFLAPLKIIFIPNMENQIPAL